MGYACCVKSEVICNNIERFSTCILPLYGICGWPQCGGEARVIYNLESREAKECEDWQSEMEEKMTAWMKGDKGQS